ncbi:EamA family transporter [Sphingomonas sp.]|uniref:DMT family transporter n=1 Tax=Sphingomonas sp. TaxID=28214 RepID=UPI00286D752D|nr:EamA family transporter [Sphingomonas sp.]
MNLHPSGAQWGRGEIILPFIVFTTIWGTTWIVIRDQLGDVPAQWSVTYRFIIAAAAMAALTRWKGESLRLGRDGLVVAAILGFLQFVINFNAVYVAEHHITSGLVATVFALLMIPNSLLAWAVLGQRPSARFAWGSLVAVAGIALLFAHELGEHPARSDAILIGIALTAVGILGASAANVYQAREQVKRFPLFALLTWAMLLGAVMDGIIALLVAGPPVIEARLGYWLGLVYLAVFASALAFSLYLPVVRKIGPGKAAYSSVLVPIIAMGFSTWLEDYRWTWMAAAGALLALGGMLLALSRSRSVVACPDAA